MKNLKKSKKKRKNENRRIKAMDFDATKYINMNIKLATICPDCNGEKVVGMGDFHNKDKVCTMYYCPKCKGKGYLPIKRKKNEKKQNN